MHPEDPPVPPEAVPSPASAADPAGAAPMARAEAPPSAPAPTAAATTKPPADETLAANAPVDAEKPLDEQQLRRLSRRGFAIAGGALVATVAGLRWIGTAAPDAGVAAPLRRVLELNEHVAALAWPPTRLAPTFAVDRATEPRVNGDEGFGDELPESILKDPDSWLFKVEQDAGGAAPRAASLAEVKRLPKNEHVTELKCIEGWSTVVHWSGTRLADFAAATGLASRSGRPYDPETPPSDLYSYVALETPDGGYYVGLDIASALHPQTLLCYEMNGEALDEEHGAPLRLVIPVKYGIKNLKRIGVLRFTDRRPKDYWGERGYDWYAGL